MKSTSEILVILQGFKTKAFEKYGFTRLGIFGSAARGEQTENSDVDICYEGKAPSLLTLDRIQQELEELLGCSVDLVRIRENMNTTLKKRILNEGIYI
jgi:predicted nucleotidyltransferase